LDNETTQAPVNTRALEASLNLIGLATGIQNLAGMVKVLHDALDMAENFGRESAQEDGQEQYDDGYIDAVHDYENSPNGARDQADFIQEQRDLRAAALALDPTMQVQ
jgi:hypothetical protein